jgi:signal transduction histidine kinase
VVITPVRGAAGELIGFAKVTRDLTQRKLMEEELSHSREQLRLLSAHLETVQEQERARIAREIHDELGGMLTGLKMDVTQLRNRLEVKDPKTSDKFSGLLQAIDQSVKTVRRIASELRPAVLDDFGLLAAMEWQLDEFHRRSQIESEWKSNAADLQLPADMAIAIFRVFQESLTNIARHAQATRVEVTVEVTEQAFMLEVRDNGVGISLPQVRGKRSLGLAGMRERVTQLGGQLVIDGVPEQGTTVSMTVPLLNEQA